MTTQYWYDPSSSFDDDSGRVPVGLHPPTRLRRNAHTPRTLDPYYEILRRSGQIPPAVDYPTARASVGVNDARLPAAYAPSRVHTVGDLLASRYREPTLNLLGVLCSWGAVTNNQAAAFTGEAALADPRSKLVASLFVAGLIRIESPYLNHGLADAGQAAVLYQLGHRAVMRKLRKQLTHAEWVAVTGCRPLPKGSGHPRHDALAAELALRAAEVLPVATVLGPQFSQFASLVPPRPRFRPPKGGPDLVLVREDGLRVAVEVTATLGTAFEKKVDRWVKLLEQAPLATSGLVVVFLVAGRVEGTVNKADRWPENETRRTVGKAIAGTLSRHVAERMYVAHWRDWFPAPLTAAPDFLDLTAYTPIRHRGAAKPEWTPASLADQDLFGFTPDQGVDTHSIVHAARMLGQTPVGPRRAHDDPEPHHEALRALNDVAGWPVVLPPLRPEAEGRTVGAPQGSAGHARFPARLLGSTHSNQPVLIPAHGPASRLTPDTPTVYPTHPGADTQWTVPGNPAHARAARTAGRRLRAEYLVAVAEGLVTIADVMLAAAEPTHAALRNIELKQLCLATGMGLTRWREVRDLTLAVLDATATEKQMTIGWLHDPRAGGRRHYAFADALRDRNQPPWPGFPWQDTTT